VSLAISTYVVLPHCSINVSNISYNAHVEYSRLFQYVRYKNGFNYLGNIKENLSPQN